jgi:hypothetical protein
VKISNGIGQIDVNLFADEIEEIVDFNKSANRKKSY